MTAMETTTSTPAAVAEAPASALTSAERRLRFCMKLWVASFALEVVLYLWWAWAGPDDSRAFAINSVAKDLTFLILGALVIADVRRFGRMMTVLLQSDCAW